MKDWYNNFSLSTKLSTSSVFTTSTATFASVGTAGTNAYIYGKIINKSSLPVYCMLQASSSGVSFKEKPGATSYGLVKDSTTATYNSTSSLALAYATYYGFVKDGSGNTYTCSLKIVGPSRTAYRCSAAGTKRCDCKCTNAMCSSTSIGTLTCSSWCSRRCIDYGGMVASNEVHTCPGNGWSNGSTCYIWPSSASCPSGYSNLTTENVCAAGETSITSGSNTYCVQ